MRRAFESMNEMEVAAFVAMAAFVALFLMLGDALWKSIAVRPPQNSKSNDTAVCGDTGFQQELASKNQRGLLAQSFRLNNLPSRRPQQNPV